MIANRELHCSLFVCFNAKPLINKTILKTCNLNQKKCKKSEFDIRIFAYI